MRRVGSRASLLELLLPAMLILGAPPAHAVQPESCTYLYVEDFSTNKAVTDSYAHSSILERRPDIFLNGVLVYEACGFGSRGLTFYRGFLVDADAYLYYRFPLTPMPTDMSGGAVTFDVWPVAVPPYRAALAVSISFDGAPDVYEVPIVTAGRQLISLSASQPFTNVLVRFRGAGVCLDNLYVCLDNATPARGSTWGALKGLYR